MITLHCEVYYSDTTAATIVLMEMIWIYKLKLSIVFLLQYNRFMYLKSVKMFLKYLEYNFVKSYSSTWCIGIEDCGGEVESVQVFTIRVSNFSQI